MSGCKKVHTVNSETHDLATSSYVGPSLDKYGSLRLLLTLQFNQTSCHRQNAQGHVTNKTVGERWPHERSALVHSVCQQKQYTSRQDSVVRYCQFRFDMPLNPPLIPLPPTHTEQWLTQSVKWLKWTKYLNLEHVLSKKKEKKKNKNKCNSIAQLLLCPLDTVISPNPIAPLLLCPLDTVTYAYPTAPLLLCPLDTVTSSNPIAPLLLCPLDTVTSPNPIAPPPLVLALSIWYCHIPYTHLYPSCSE